MEQGSQQGRDSDQRRLLRVRCAHHPHSLCTTFDVDVKFLLKYWRQAYTITQEINVDFESMYHSICTFKPTETDYPFFRLDIQNFRKSSSKTWQHNQSRKSVHPIYGNQFRLFILQRRKWSIKQPRRYRKKNRNWRYKLAFRKSPSNQSLSPQMTPLVSSFSSAKLPYDLSTSVPPPTEFANA